MIADIDKRRLDVISSPVFMAVDTNRPGQVRDAILAYLGKHSEASSAEIVKAVSASLGKKVPASSVRSYLNLNVGETFERVGWGRYRLKKR